MSKRNEHPASPAGATAFAEDPENGADVTTVPDLELDEDDELDPKGGGLVCATGRHLPGGRVTC